MPDKTPIDLFQLLVSDVMLETVMDETKLYSQQYTATHNLGPKSRVHKWNNTPHTLAELKKFLALIITMGIVDYPQVKRRLGNHLAFCIVHLQFSDVKKLILADHEVPVRCCKYSYFITIVLK